jgi:hypothetical protein
VGSWSSAAADDVAEASRTAMQLGQEVPARRRV